MPLCRRFATRVTRARETSASAAAEERVPKVSGYNPIHLSRHPRCFSLSLSSCERDSRDLIVVAYRNGTRRGLAALPLQTIQTI